MQELVVESLVVSLAMVVFYVLVDETTQMPLAERDHACETLLFDRPDEPLGIGVEIGILRRQPNRLNTGALQYNARPQWLADAHAALDAAVATACGWSAETSDDEALRELLALNGDGR